MTNTNDVKVFQNQIAEYLENLSVNPYADLTRESVQDELEDAIAKVAKYSKPDAIKIDLLAKYSQQLLITKYVVDAYKSIDEVEARLVKDGIQLSSTNILKKVEEIAVLFGIPVTIGEKAVVNAKSVASGTAKLAKDAVRSTLGFGLGIVGDILNSATKAVSNVQQTVENPQPQVPNQQQ